MLVIHVHAGVGGLASDVTVWNRAVERGFDLPNGQYLLGDGVYPQSRMICKPFPATRYHVSDQMGADNP